MNKELYHTQENRGTVLTSPIICERDDAWMGDAYYYWLSEDDAIFWGRVVKAKRTGSFSVYSSNIKSENILDTVFNEEHYSFWIRNIEKVAERFHRLGKKPTLKQINQYFHENSIWEGLDGIMFQDISGNPEHYLVEGFQYKKRIQLAVYDKKIIFTFALHFESEG